MKSGRRPLSPFPLQFDAMSFQVAQVQWSPLPCMVTTVPSHRDADLDGSTLAVCSNSPRTLWDLPTRGGLRFHNLTGWRQSDRHIIVLVLFPYSFDQAFQHTCANHLFHVCIEDHLLADTSTLQAQSVLIKLSHGMIPFPRTRSCSMMCSNSFQIHHNVDLSAFQYLPLTLLNSTSSCGEGPAGGSGISMT